MITRMFVTTIVFFLTIRAFWSDALGADQVFNPFGILLLELTLLVWFGWDTIHDAFTAAKRRVERADHTPGLCDHRGMENLKHPSQWCHSSSP
jgi:energy-coupling factor transporter transmembrane protein EcfT